MIINLENEELEFKKNEAMNISAFLNEGIEKQIFEFLKKEGYRPKNDLNYIKNLKKRLEKKGLLLKVEYELPSYTTDISNNLSVSVKMGYKISFEKIEGGAINGK